MTVFQLTEAAFAAVGVWVVGLLLLCLVIFAWTERLRRPRPETLPPYPQDTHPTVRPAQLNTARPVTHRRRDSHEHPAR